MAADTSGTPVPWSTPSAAEVAEAAGATDLFVFRRIADGRFAHVGGIGRGAGWAGIVEIGVEQEPLVERALSTGEVVRRSEPDPWHVLGPYYAQCAVVVSVTQDVFVVFGAESDRMAAVPDDDLTSLARFAAEALVEVTPAKRLADELEALNAVRELLHSPADTFEEALQRLVDQATASLSCDLGFLYVPERRQLAVCDKRDGASVDAEAATRTLAALAERGSFPVCIQRAAEDELPAPFASADGVLAYYVLELVQPVSGVLLLLHTQAGVARGFTLLCQSLGARLVEAAEPLLAAALLRDTLNADLERAEREARRDALTGLANRLAWAEALASRRRDRGVAGEHRARRLPRSQVHQRPARPRGRRPRALSRRSGALGQRAYARSRRASGRGRVRGPSPRRRREGNPAVVERIEAAIADDHQHGQPDIRLAIGAATARAGNLEAAQLQADAEMVAAKKSAGEPRAATR